MLDEFNYEWWYSRKEVEEQKRQAALRTHLEWKDVEVELIGDHPHAGRRGQPTGKVIGEVGHRMIEIRFPEGDCCFAKAHHLILTKPFRGVCMGFTF